MTRSITATGAVAGLIGVLTWAGPAVAQIGTHPSTFDDVASRIAAATDEPGNRLAASLTQEGHWRFANRTGERMTAADRPELDRILKLLLPDSVKAPAAPLSLLIAEEAVYRAPPAWRLLPDDATTRVLVGGTERKVVRTPASRSPAFELRPRLLVAADGRDSVVEFDRLLASPLAEVRILSMDPAGAGILAPRRPRSTQGGPVVEPVDPERVALALHSLARQTVVITGRIEGERLHVRPGSGSGLWLPLPPVLAAAHAADIDLIVVSTDGGRQPGARTWLWQRIDVRNLDTAAMRPTLGDFLRALGGERAFLIEAARSSVGRIALDGTVMRVGERDSWTAPISDAISDLASQTVGTVQATGLRASLIDSARRGELSRRIVPGIPSRVQLGYLALLGLGFLGWPAARRWWQRLWPPEQCSEYASQGGYLAARAVRAVTYVALFMPLVGPLSAPAFLAAIVRRWAGAARPPAT